MSLEIRNADGLTFEEFPARRRGEDAKPTTREVEGVEEMAVASSGSPPARQIRIDAE